MCKSAASTTWKNSTKVHVCSKNKACAVPSDIGISSLVLRVCHGHDLEEGFGTETRISCFECLTLLVSALPWKKWLWSAITSKPTIDRRARNRPEPTLSGFHRKAIGVFSMIISITECAFLSMGDDSTFVRPVCQLSNVVFLAVPDVLVQQSAQLWYTMVDSLLNVDALPDTRRFTSATIAASIGGGKTPEGKLQEICSSARVFLQNHTSSDGLVSRLLLSIDTTGSAVTSIARDLLAGVLRTYPERIVAQMDRFLLLCVPEPTSLRDSNRMCNLTVDGIQLFAAFMLGRKDFCCDTVDERLLACPAKAAARLVLQLRNGMAQSRFVLPCLEIAGSLLPRDWGLVTSSRQTFQAVLTLSSTSIPVIKAEMCKAIAGMCQSYLAEIRSGYEEEAEEIVDLVIDAMTAAVVEKKDSVRAMVRICFVMMYARAHSVNYELLTDS